MASATVPQEPRPSGFEALLFSAKAAGAGLLSLLVCEVFRFPGAVWPAVISAVLVTQPGLHPSLKASLFRLLANLIGAVLGAILLSVLGSAPAAMALGVVLAGLVCHYARLDDALRPAYAAVVIVALRVGPQIWIGSLDRVLAVVIGCASALLAGLVFDQLFQRSAGWMKRHRLAGHATE